MNGIQYYEDLGISLDNTDTKSLLSKLKAGEAILTVVPGLDSAVVILDNVITLRDQVTGARDKALSYINKITDYIETAEKAVNEYTIAVSITQNGLIAPLNSTNELKTMNTAEVLAGLVPAYNAGTIGALLATYVEEDTVLNTTLSAATQVANTWISYLDTTVKPNLKKAEATLTQIDNYIDQLDNKLGEYMDIVLARLQFCNIFECIDSPTSVSAVIPKDTLEDLDNKEENSYKSITDLSGTIQGKVADIAKIVSASALPKLG